MDALGLAMSAMLLIAKIAKARKADRDLSMVISIIPMSNVIECGSNRPNALNAEPESFQPVFAELGKWLRAYFVGAAVGFAPGIGRREQSRCGGL